MVKPALSDSVRAKISAKFRVFRSFRDELNIFLVSYISDYMRLQNHSPSDRRRCLRKKYGLRAPRINYCFRTDTGFLWSVRNIAIVLGRNRSSISRALSRMRDSDFWREKVTSLHSVAPSFGGVDIDVYRQDIFDVLMDWYEAEYLKRFIRSRRSNSDDAPEMSALMGFWEGLKAGESVQKYVSYDFMPGHGKETGGGFLGAVFRWLKGLLRL